MKEYFWTCTACGTPNVRLVDRKKEQQVTLNCGQCGEPAHIPEQCIELHYSGSGPFPDGLTTSTCTQVMWRSNDV